MKTKPLDQLEKSTDRKFVACALAAGVRMASFERDYNNNRVTWYLERSDLLKRVDREYVTGRLSLPVHQLFYQLEILTTQTQPKKNYENER